MGNWVWVVLGLLLIIMALAMCCEAYLMGYDEGWRAGYRRGIHIKRGDKKE